MKKIEVRLETINPVIIADIGENNIMLNTKNYIPGATLLGVFAKNFIEKNNINNDAHKNNDFKSIFLDNNIIFQNLYIEKDKKNYYPTPYSVRQEKDGDNIYDLLLQEENFDKQTKNISLYSYLKDGYISITEVEKDISFHHARDRITGTAKEGIIFNYEYIKPKQTFFGLIVGSDFHILKFYEKIDKEIYARIGRSRNSQYGKVKITLSEPKEYIKDINIDEVEKEDVIMTFLSDAIIYNMYGFSTTNIKDIENILNVKIKDGFIKQSRNEQFVSVWRLKKTSENVIGAGSCLLLESLPSNYKELEQKGIGERKNEGFGRVIFGYQTDDKLQKRKVSEDSIPRPVEPIPDFVKSLIINIVKNNEIRKIKQQALEDAHRFENLPSKSLLGKLQHFSKDIDKFKENFEYISKKDIAKSQLLTSHNGHQTLLDFINKKVSYDFKSVLGSNETKLFNDIQLDKDVIVNDKNYKMKLKREYFVTFFNFLRKKGG